MTATVTVQDIYRTIRDVPDFPKPGILFKDITPLLLDPRAFRRAVELMSTAFAGAGVTRVVSIESRGFEAQRRQKVGAICERQLCQLRFDFCGKRNDLGLLTTFFYRIAQRS